MSLRRVRWLAIDEADAMLGAADGITRGAPRSESNRALIPSHVRPTHPPLRRAVRAETDAVLERLHGRRGRLSRRPPQAILTAATMSAEHEAAARRW